MDDDGGNEWMVLFGWQAGRLLLLAGWRWWHKIEIRDFFPSVLYSTFSPIFFRGTFFSFYLHLSIIDVCCLFVSCIHPSIAEFALISLIGVFFLDLFRRAVLVVVFFNIFIIYHMHDVL